MVLFFLKKLIFILWFVALIFVAWGGARYLAFFNFIQINLNKQFYEIQNLKHLAFGDGCHREP
ncbi:MAG: hypothetical protein EAZ67_10770 [Cytophagales bacterium]|nr:MAG: hypothetical protein EAZ67_10770 [Cytophagales bacterium]